MAAELLFVFDPLCGWCYAAHPALAALQAATTLPLRMLPSGIFAGPNARPMTAEFRDYAWQHDQHIQQLTGQPFSEVYYRQVLSDFSRPLDSAAATLAFHLLSRARPEAGVDILHRIQQLRYVQGRDITAPEVLADLATDYGLNRDDFLAAFSGHGAAAREVHAVAMETQQLMNRLRLRGVPDLILRKPAGDTIVPTAMLYRDGAVLLQWIAAQTA